ncbi:MAG TPA: elongation factor G [Phycisphaerae bacterium]|nr:elongation factor G [Phycisphaerae bacterium]
MAVFGVQDYRNIALVGHGGAGKTTLAEACLLRAGVTKRQGSVPDGTSILDYMDEEKEKGCSLDSAVCSMVHGGKHINLIDTPGSTDFCGQAIVSLAAVETAVLVVSAGAGIEVNTRKMMQRAGDFGLARMIVINKIDAENANLEELFEQLREVFGPECVPINLTSGNRSAVVDCLAGGGGDVDFGSAGSAHEAVLEAIVGVDDDLMEKYLGGEAEEAAVLAEAPAALAAGVMVPILFTNAKDGVGVSELLDAIVRLAPDPTVGKKRVLTDGDSETEIVPSAEGAFLGQVFKNATDPKSHIKYSLIRVLSGRLTSDQSIKTLAEHKGMRPGQILRFRGMEHEDLEAGVAGDIIALARLDLHIGDVVYTANGGKIQMPSVPNPMFALAIEPKARGDEDKISAALKRFADEDPCFKVDRSTATKEMVVRGVGDMHLRTVLARMAHYYKVDVETHTPRIPYHETITAGVNDVEYTHKKQTGGAGQFARVVVNLVPAERGEGYEFVDKIFGGAIDQSFRPSVDKGVRAQMAEGVLAGYPVVDVKVELIDGKTHPVDSKDIAFQIAGRGVFKYAFMKAKPVLLEPIVTVEVTAPTENVGDLQGDLASRRGRPQGQDVLPGGFAVIRALVPLAELAEYHSRLSSITGGRGSYAMEFSHYETVPSNVQQQIVAAARKPTE